MVSQTESTRSRVYPGHLDSREQSLLIMSCDSCAIRTPTSYLVWFACPASLFPSSVCREQLVPPRKTLHGCLEQGVGQGLWGTCEGAEGLWRDTETLMLEVGWMWGRAGRLFREGHVCTSKERYLTRPGERVQGRVLLTKPSQAGSQMFSCSF